jgi:naphthoate synthase
MEPSAQRRLARVAAHLAPSLPLAVVPAVTHYPTASASSPTVDSYNHVHGDVSSEPSDWRAVTDESGKPFVDVIYEKAVEEGICQGVT